MRYETATGERYFIGCVGETQQDLSRGMKDFASVNEADVESFNKNRNIIIMKDGTILLGRTADKEMSLGIRFHQVMIFGSVSVDFLHFLKQDVLLPGVDPERQIIYYPSEDNQYKFIINK